MVDVRRQLASPTDTLVIYLVSTHMRPVRRTRNPRPEKCGAHANPLRIFQYFPVYFHCHSEPWRWFNTPSSSPSYCTPHRQLGLYQRGRQATSRSNCTTCYPARPVYDLTPSQLAADMDGNLLANILNNPCHVSYKLLPNNTEHTHNLRPRRHSLSLNVKTNCNNFINRLLFKDIY